MGSRDRVDDQFLRLQLDLSPRRARLGGKSLSVRLRGFAERYNEVVADNRLQAECSIDGQAAIGKRSAIWLGGRLEGRSYPDSAVRDFRRGTVLAGVVAPVPAGRLGLSVAFRGADFARTPRRDRMSRALILEFARPLRRGLDLSSAAEFEWSRLGRPAIRKLAGCAPEYGGDQRDRSREIRLRVRYVRGWLWEAGFGWESLLSNSFGFSRGTKRFEGIVAGWLPASIMLRARGRLEQTNYEDDDLGCIFVDAGSDPEAGEELSTIQVRLRRRLRGALALEGGLSGFRNESLLVGHYYAKWVTSVGLIWSPGDESAF